MSLFHPECPVATIDLQWRIGPGGIVRGGIPALLRDSQRFEFDGFTVSVPSDLDTVMLAALYTVREFPIGGSTKLVCDLDLALAKWFKNRVDLVVEHARKRGLLRVLYAATAYGLTCLPDPLALRHLALVLPQDDDAARWHEWFSRWPASGPGSSEMLRHVLATSTKSRSYGLLLYPLFPDSWMRRALVAGHVAQHVVASRVFGRFLRARVDALTTGVVGGHNVSTL